MHYTNASAAPSRRYSVGGSTTTNISQVSTPQGETSPTILENILSPEITTFQPRLNPSHQSPLFKN